MNEFMSNGSKSKGLDVLNALPPKTAFIAGLVGGVLIILAIGFFILLATMINGGTLKLPGEKLADKTTVEDSGNAAVDPSNDAAPVDQPVNDPPAITDQDHFLGNSSAKIILVEYSDFECPYCQSFHLTMQQVVDKYPNDVKWVYRHFPLSFHAGSQKKAEASECVAELGGNGAFWKFADSLMTQQPEVSALGPLVTSAGVDLTKFNDCMSSGKYANYVKDQLSSGSSAGVSGTPATFVVSPGGDTQLIPGALPIESVEQVIQSLL